MHCQNCGKENKPDAKFCKECGALLHQSLEEIEISVQNKKKKRKYGIYLAAVAAFVIVCIAGVLYAVREIGQNGIEGEFDSDKNVEIQTKSESNGDSIEQKQNQINEAAETVVENTYDRAIEKLISDLRGQGMANGEAFITCQATTLYDFPSEAGGYLNYISVDLDDDGIEEILSTYLVPQDCTLWVRLYKFTESEFQLMAEESIAAIDGFSDMELYLFKNTQKNLWQILYTNQTVGSYTGVEAFSVQLFDVNMDINLYKAWTWDSFQSLPEEAYGYINEMQQEGISYANLGRFEFGQRDFNLSMLAKSNISVQGDIPSLYTVQMCIFNEEMYVQDKKFSELFANEDIQNSLEKLAFTGAAFQNADELENTLDSYVFNEFYTFRFSEYQQDSEGYIMVPKEDVLNYINNTFGLNKEEFFIDKEGQLGEYFADGYYHIGGAFAGDIRMFIFMEYECVSKSEYKVRVDAVFEDGTAEDSHYYFNIQPSDTENEFIVSSLWVE